MVDVIQIVGERVQDEWRRKLNKQYTFRKDKSSARVELIEVQYGAPVPSAGNLVQADEATYKNGSPIEKSEETFAVSKKTFTTFSYSLKEGFGVKLTASLEVPIVGKTGVETTVSFESTQTQGNGEEQTWTHTTKIIVPPKKQVKASFMVQETKFDAPIWGRVRVRGRLFLQSPEWTLPHLEPDIGGLIDSFGWWPGTFEYGMEGSFVAVRGTSFIVETKESDLPLPTPSGARGSEIKV
jgi:Clostridium epsilon toxin ETX/Bacillus mosquitocidal toxin MTX2